MAPYRVGHKRLFLPIKKGRLKDLSKNILSQWVQRTILEAYAKANEEDTRLYLHKTFYIRDISTTSDDLMSLGPNMAAQEIINQR